MHGGGPGAVLPPGPGLIGVGNLGPFPLRKRNVQRIPTLTHLLIRQIPRYGFTVLACVTPIGHGKLPSRCRATREYLADH